jgi:bacillithiol biosynthesis deacetylase BshB1
MSCDLLVFAPHPDDAEIHCGGTIAAQVRQGATVVVVDASRGELASRGTAAEREREAAAAAGILGLAGRENLALPDGAVPGDDPAARLLVVDAIRRHRPQVVLCISAHARHPDHQALARLVGGAVKAAAFHKLATPGGSAAVGGVRLWFYEAELPATPHLLVPLRDDDWRIKMAAVRCYASQLHQAHAQLPATTIADPGFLGWIEARGRAWGHHAGAGFAEAFSGPELPRVGDLRTL